MDPFGRLCQIGNLKGVEDAIKIGADVNTLDLFGWTGLMMALHHNHPAVATMLVQNPAVDVNIASDNGDCALHIAAMDDEMGDCLALILAREDLTTVNSQDEDGSTPLMVAIQNRATRCMEVLLSDDRTDPNIRDIGIFRSKGVMPIMLAAQRNFVPELQLLLADARVDLAQQGRTLEEAIRAPCDGGGMGSWKCQCGSANGHPEVALLVEKERERRKAALPSSSSEED